MKTTLSRKRLEAARAFVLAEGRPLDQALLLHAMGEGAGEAVLEALAPFQNPDGGFGHGLEPDTPSPASSAIAASIGLRFLARTGAGGDQPMVVAAIRWLDAHLDRDLGVWPIIEPDVDLAPHAPWWNWSEDLAASWNGFRFNPTAEFLGLLYRYRTAAPDGMMAAAEAGMRRALAGLEAIESPYDLKCAIRLAETADAPADISASLADLVRRSIGAHDPADEHISPFDVAPTPTSLFAGAVCGRLEAAFGALVAAQEKDGGWAPFWDWSGVDAEAWARAKRDWRGWLTREAIEVFWAYGRVEAA